MRLRILESILFLLAGTFMVSADVRFNPEAYSFGVIREDGGKVRGEVVLHNEGSEPIVIKRLRTSCGCTSAGVGREEVAAGDSTQVWVEFDPMGRLGDFSKKVRVYLADEEKPKIFYITGTVLGGKETAAKGYPYFYGSLRLSDERVTLSPDSSGTLLGNLYIYNSSDDTVPIEIETLTPGVEGIPSSESLGPGETGTVLIRYRDPSGTTDSFARGEIKVNGAKISVVR